MPRIKQGNPQNLSRKHSLRSEMTSAERRLWSRLRAKQFFGLKFRRQHGVGPYIVDFYCSERLTVIAVDGDVHGEELRKQKTSRGKRIGRVIYLPLTPPYKGGAVGAETGRKLLCVLSVFAR
jgi:very-short-patch-repair endonuclease